MTGSTVVRRAAALAAQLPVLRVGSTRAATPAVRAAGAVGPTHSLPLALQESLYFYDAEKSGPARSLNDQPLEWRGDADLSDSHVPLVSSAHTSPGTNLSAAFI